MSTLGVFIDIEGAFDKTTLYSRHSALTRHDIEPIMSLWVQSMLSNRAANITVGEVTTRRLVKRGRPQGGVLSPLLWNMVADNLIRSLNTKGYYAIDYADDIYIMYPNHRQI